MRSAPRACQTATRIDAPWVCVALQTNGAPRHTQASPPEKSLNREVGDLASGQVGKWASGRFGEQATGQLGDLATGLTGKLGSYTGGAGSGPYQVAKSLNCGVARLPNCRLSRAWRLCARTETFFRMISLDRSAKKHADAVGSLSGSLASGKPASTLRTSTGTPLRVRYWAARQSGDWENRRLDDWEMQESER